MPQNNRVVSEFDLRTDMEHYYRHSVVTYINPEGTRLAASVNCFRGDNDELTVDIHVLPPDPDSTWASVINVPFETIDWCIPPLGAVLLDGHWFQLQRVPARRMRKGYHNETISWAFLEDSEYNEGYDVRDERVVRQIWYGQPDRISNNVVVWNKGIYYTTDKVATIDDEGNVLLIPNKEKLGEFVCKALANNWELATSKYSVRTLPSSVPMPSV